MSGRLFASPLFLGFDHLEQMLERASKTSSDGYPPYNIEQISTTGLRITLAVAGFEMDDLQITQEDNQLVIRGRQNDDPQGRVFLHRGIAARQFQRAFVLAEGIDVGGAWLERGLLHIDLVRPQPEVRVKRIEISQGAGHGAGHGSVHAGAPLGSRASEETGPTRTVGKQAGSTEIGRAPARLPRVVRSVEIED